MFQERVVCNNEVKVCFLDKQYSHIAVIDRSKKSLTGFTRDEIILFAYHALQSLVHLEDVFILDGLVRVDIFKSNEGHLVINELESLEADYNGHHREMSQTDIFLSTYWEKAIYKCLCSK